MTEPLRKAARWWRGAALGGIALCGLLTPLTISLPLVAQEFSGKTESRRIAFKSVLEAAHPGTSAARVAPLDARSLAGLSAYFARNRAPVLLELIDTRDPWSTAFAPALEREYRVEKLGEWPSTFAGLPFSTLYVYVSPHYSYFLVHGPAGAESPR